MAGQTEFDCIVVGGGPAGLAAAAGIARLGVSVALADEHGRDRRSDAGHDIARTAALFPPSLAVLRNLGAWQDLNAAAEPMTALRLIDDTGGLLRAPEVLFNARDVGLDALAFNIPNADLVRALSLAAADAGVVFLEHGRVGSVLPGADGVAVVLGDGSRREARFLVGSDGRNSPTRSAAGIAWRAWTYDQSALITVFEHSRAHSGVSTELHGPAGPCTTVPLPGKRSSLVWVDRPAVIEGLMAADQQAFSAALGVRLKGLLGEVSGGHSRRQFAMAGLMAERMSRGLVALVGEAGHALPPIGAQGLNLGFADAAVLVDQIGAWKASAGTRSPELALAGYASLREGDIRRRAGAVDLLNRSLDAGNTAARLMRGAGLHLLAALPSARQMLMTRGLEPPDPTPSLMRVEAAHPAAIGVKV